MADDQRGAGVEHETRPEYPTCPSCGGGSFYVDGFLGYRQRYDSEFEAWSSAVIDWEFDNPVRAYCVKCETDVSELLQMRGVVDLYEVSWTRRQE